MQAFRWGLGHGAGRAVSTSGANDTTKFGNKQEKILDKGGDAGAPAPHASVVSGTRKPLLTNGKGHPYNSACL